MYKQTSLTTRQAICLGLAVALCLSAYYSLSHPPRPAVSNWSDDYGLLELDRETGFGTTWTTFDTTYACDGIVEIGDTAACQSGLKYLTALSGNMMAQQTYL